MAGQPPRVASTSDQLPSPIRRELQDRPGRDPAAPETWSGRPIRVLFVSEVLLMRAGLRQVLEGAGHVLVGETGTWDETLTLVTRERPHVVVIDLDIRSKALTCIPAVAAVPGTRVVVLSDRTRSIDQQRLMELGAAGMVLKNEPPEILLKAIEKVHAGEVWLDRTRMADAIKRLTRRKQAGDPDAERISTLTPRERQIIALVGDGLKNGPIAEFLNVSEATVRNHLTSILDKLGLSDRFELAVYAYRQGLVHYPEAKDCRRAVDSWRPPAHGDAVRR